MANKKVRVGSDYRYNPVLFDQLNPPFGVKPGEVVRVVNLPGCPRAGTMGMCHVAKDGRFAGMVCTNSLEPVKKSKTDFFGSGRESEPVSRATAKSAVRQPNREKRPRCQPFQGMERDTASKGAKPTFSPIPYNSWRLSLIQGDACHEF